MDSFSYSSQIKCFGEHVDMDISSCLLCGSRDETLAAVFNYVLHIVRVEVLTTMIRKITVYWIMKTYCVDTARHFGEYIASVFWDKEEVKQESNRSRRHAELTCT
jgi:hypothetical protein